MVAARTQETEPKNIKQGKNRVRQMRDKTTGKSSGPVSLNSVTYLPPPAFIGIVSVALTSWSMAAQQLVSCEPSDSSSTAAEIENIAIVYALQDSLR